MISLSAVNLLAVLVGGIISMVVGFFWYGPLFGEAWMRMLGRTREEIESSSSASMYVVTFVVSLIAAFVLNLVVRAFGATSLLDGVVAGAVAWIGIGATSHVTNSIFEDRPTGIWLLFAAYQLVVSIIQGAIFAVWV